MKNQRGFAAFEILILVLLLGVLGFVGYRAYTASQVKPSVDSSTAKIETKPSKSEGAIADCSPDAPDGTFESSEKPSPKGTYVAVLTAIPDWLQIDIKAQNGKFIACAVPTEEDQKAMGLGTKIKPQYGLHFGEWVSDTRFTIKIPNAEGHEYTYEVDAATGKVDISSYRQVK